jgi:putative membrane protein
MRQNFKKIGKGFLIGLSTIIPGFSGGTMILILGCLVEFTTNLSMLLKRPILAIKELSGYFIGIILGVVSTTYFVLSCLKKYPILTASFFVGLIIGTIPIVFKETNYQKPKFYTLLCFTLSFIISLMLSTFKSDIVILNVNNINVINVIYVFLISIIAFAMMIIPAASGSLILLIFGVYDFILEVFKDFITNFFSFRLNLILNDLLILIPFGLGGLIGIVIISKVLNKLLLKHSMSIWYIILGLLISSIYTVYESVYNNYLFDNMSIFYGNIKFNIVGSVILFFTAICCLSKLKSINNNKTKKEVLL